MEKQNDKNAASSRCSNLEMVRIIAMSMIVVWHFYVHGGLDQFGMKIVPALTIYGVDLFVLISGVFLIKARWQSIIRLALIILLFQIFSFASCLMFSENVDGRVFTSMLRAIVAPFSGPKQWFINVYFVLIVLSPLINLGLRSWSLPQFRIFMFIMTVVEFYSCFLMHNFVNRDGYSLFNFLYIYILGYYLMREEGVKRIGSPWLVFIILGCIVVNCLLAGFMPYQQWLYQSYSSPFIIAVPVAIMLLAYRIQFKSKAVNSIAASSLGVYLLQDGILGYNLIYPIQQEIACSKGPLAYFVSALVIFVGLWLVSWLLMQLIGLFVPSVSQWLASKLSALCNIESISVERNSTDH